MKNILIPLLQVLANIMSMKFLGFLTDLLGFVVIVYIAEYLLMVKL